MQPTRRAVLASGAAVAALGGLGVVAADLPAAAPGFRVLGVGEADVVRALAEALFPPGNPLGVSGADLDVPALVDELLGDMLEPVVTPVFRYILRLLDAGTLASRGVRFAALPLADRLSVLDVWQDNGVLPRRMAYEALKTVMGMAFFNAREVAEAVGWRAECHAWGDA